MLNLITSLSVILLMMTQAIHATQRINCSKADTPIEKTICNDETLSKLDSILHTIHKISIEKSKTPNIIKEDQLHWLTNQTNTNEEKLCENYQDKVEELLQNAEVRSAILHNLFNEKNTVDPYIKEAAILSFLKAKDADLIDGYYRGGYLLEPFKKSENLELIKLSDNKIVVFLNIDSTGGFSSSGQKEVYGIFLLSKINGKINIEPYTLPHPKTVEFDAPADSPHILNGIFRFPESGAKKKILTYIFSSSRDDAGVFVEWELTDKGAKIIKEGKNEWEG